MVSLALLEVLAVELLGVCELLGVVWLELLGVVWLELLADGLLELELELGGYDELL